MFYIGQLDATHKEKDTPTKLEIPGKINAMAFGVILTVFLDIDGQVLTVQSNHLSTEVLEVIDGLDTTLFCRPLELIKNARQYY